MVRTIRRIEESFCPGGDEPGAVQNDVAQFVAEVSSTWLTRDNDGVSLVTEPSLQKTNLRGLARAITALKGDEHASH
jgi:hypothetical protein